MLQMQDTNFPLFCYVKDFIFQYFWFSLVNNFCKRSLNFFHSHLYYNKKIVEVEIVFVCLLFKNVIMTLKMLIQPILAHYCLKRQKLKSSNKFYLNHLSSFSKIYRKLQGKVSVQRFVDHLWPLKCRHKWYQMSYLTKVEKWGMI